MQQSSRLWERSLRGCAVLFVSAFAVYAQVPVSNSFVTPIQPGQLPPKLPAQVPAEILPDNDFPLATPVEAVPGSPALDLNGKFDYYVKSIASPESISRVALTSGFREIGGDASNSRSYMQNFGSRYAEHVTKRTVQFGIGALRGEDPRFRRSNKDGFWARTGFVLSRTVLTDMDNGGTSIAAGKLVGAFAGNAISAYWHPSHPDPLKHGLKDTGINLASDVGIRMLREFWPDLKSLFKR